MTQLPYESNGNFFVRQVLPGFEPGLLDSKSKVITNYTIGPRQQCVCVLWGEEQKKSHSALTIPEWSPTSVLGKPNDA